MKSIVKSGRSTSSIVSSPVNGDIGFRIAGSPGSGPGRSATVPLKMPNANPAYLATGRQRADGSRPSGKRRNKNVGINPVIGSHSQELNHAAHSPPGSPGWTRYA
jgi:hypothetical protein